METENGSSSVDEIPCFKADIDPLIHMSEQKKKPVYSEKSIDD